MLKKLLFIGLAAGFVSFEASASPAPECDASKGGKPCAFNGKNDGKCIRSLKNMWVCQYNG